MSILSNMKCLSFITAIALATIFTACSSDDIPVQHPDDYGTITFSVKTQKLITRSNPYEDYSPSRHPSTMGTFGYCNANIANPIFNNDVVTYDPVEKNWTDALNRRWEDYKGTTTFDFLAYMPQTGGASVALTADGEYSLTIPFSIPDGMPFLFDTRQAPIICASPDRKVALDSKGAKLDFDHVVNMQFDQTLTGYRLLFKLDPTMGAIRYFRIKAVSLTGDLAAAGTVSRTYSYATDGTLKTGNISWNALQRKNYGATPVGVPYKETDDAAADNATKTLLVGADDFSQWGDVFYTIPDPKFLPTISVTYDVVLLDEDGKEVVTRNDITSSITLNKANFSNLTTGGTAMVNPIRILIQPRYLYVLADQDAYTGRLLIE